MDLIINNKSEINGSMIFQNADNFEITEYEDNYKILAPGAVDVNLDFGHITDPKYCKITCDTPIHINQGGILTQNVYMYEVRGEINAISVSNSSTADESKVRFLVAM